MERLPLIIQWLSIQSVKSRLQYIALKDLENEGKINFAAVNGYGYGWICPERMEKGEN
jgi:hypothetical protein